MRPTSDRAKESLFNILAPEISGANVLDLFCGTGGIGLEALSRGADLVVFNDISQESLDILRRNLALLRADARIYNLDYRTLLERTELKFDIIYIDPPYKTSFGADALRLIAERELLNTGGVAVFESDKPFEGEVAGLVRYDERKYGIAHLTFFTPD